jgi:hypothetical protein
MSIKAVVLSLLAALNPIAKGKAGADFGASVERGAASILGIGVRNTYEVECLGPDGEVKWRESFTNLVTTEGLNKFLDATLKTGLTTPAWYVGLVVGPSETGYAAGDTMASHAGWVETHTTYSQGTRPALTLGAVAGGSVNNSASKASYSITSNATVISGAFITDNSTKGGTTGILLAVGAFTGGDKTADNGDTVNVTVTSTITSA